MMMATEEEIKKRFLQQRMQEQYAAQHNFMQQQQLEETLKAVSSQILEPRARERLYNLKVVKPEMAMQLEMYLAQLYQAGQIKGKITDGQLVTILRKLGQKRDISIKRKLK